MSRFVITLLALAAIISIGVYFYMQPKPAFQIGDLEKQLDRVREQAETLSKIVDTEDLPDWMSLQQEYLEGVGEIIEGFEDDCDEIVEGLEEHRQEYEDEGLLSQSEVVKKIKKSKRDEIQELAAKYAVTSLESYDQLMPMIKSFCSDCPKESVVFMKVFE
ncbi:MAG: hypothetical protein JRJ87_16365 [Deltaproteobacteria bacterium]|nr:hypothetical protein [Deltaproteobacteria bacterium]